MAKIVEFPTQNVVYEGAGCTPMPARKCVTEAGPAVTSCWELSMAERLKLLETGRVFITLIGNRPQPQTIDVVDPEYPERRVIVGN